MSGLTPSCCSILKMPMKLNLGETSLKINVSFAAAVTLTLILDESGVSAVALLCCIIHEAGHIICLLAFGEKPKKIELSFYGIKLERTELPRIKSIDEIAVYASGPAANFVLSALLFVAADKLPNLKTAALISLCVGLFNLIPCRPLDGGNILFALLCRAAEQERAEKICGIVSLCLLVPMAVFGIGVLINSGNITLLAVTAYLATVTFLNKKSEENIKI